MSSTLREVHKVWYCGYHYFVTKKKYTPEMLNWVLWVSILVRPRGGNLTQNGDPRVWKLTFENLKMSNFRWVVPPPSWGKPLIGALSYFIMHHLDCFIRPSHIIGKNVSHHAHKWGANAEVNMAISQPIEWISSNVTCFQCNARQQLIDCTKGCSEIWCWKKRYWP